MQTVEFKVLSSNAVRGFVEGGGTIRYVAKSDKNGSMTWHLRGVDTLGTEFPVFIGRTGEPKVFRSANAVVSFHRSLFPEAREITIPLAP